MSGKKGAKLASVYTSNYDVFSFVFIVLGELKWLDFPTFVKSSFSFVHSNHHKLNKYHNTFPIFKCLLHELAFCPYENLVIFATFVAVLNRAFVLYPPSVCCDKNK